MDTSSAERARSLMNLGAMPAPGNANPLALTAGKFVRVAPGVIVFQAYFTQHFQGDTQKRSRGCQSGESAALADRFSNGQARSSEA